MPSPTPDNVPAIVVGASLNGLGVVRSLHKAGVEVHLVTDDLQQSTARTRLAQCWSVPSLGNESLIEALIDITNQIGRTPVLFLTQEAGVGIVSRHRDKLSEKNLFLLPEPDVVGTLTTKAGFQKTAEKLGSPIPRSQSIEETQHLDRIRSFRFPVILKPNAHSSDYSLRFKKAYRLKSYDEVVLLYKKIHTIEPRVVVQEWIEGNDNDIFFCLQHRSAGGEVDANFCGQKLRSYPPHVGGTASCTIAPQSVWEELTTKTNEFFSAALVVGLCSMEFKRHSKTGEFLMIEPTIGRTDYQEEVATWHGCNIPAAAYGSLTCQKLQHNTTVSSQYIWLDWHAERYSRAMLPTKITNQRGKRRDALFAWNDPMPWFATQLKFIKKAFRSRMKNQAKVVVNKVSP